MASAAYFFVSSEQDALRNDGFKDGSETLRADFFGLQPTGFDALYVENTGLEHEFSILIATENYEAVTLIVPKQMVEWYASISAKQLPGLISKWKLSEECPYDNDHDLLRLTHSLIRLSRLATSTHQDLYFWMTIEPPSPPS